MDVGSYLSVVGIGAVIGRYMTDRYVILGHDLIVLNVLKFPKGGKLGRSEKQWFSYGVTDL